MYCTYHTSCKFVEKPFKKEAYPVAIVQESFVIEVKVKAGVARNVHIHAPLVLLGIIKLKQTKDCIYLNCKNAPFWSRN
jgi:hypothetical protein